MAGSGTGQEELVLRVGVGSRYLLDLRPAPAESSGFWPQFMRIGGFATLTCEAFSFTQCGLVLGKVEILAVIGAYVGIFEKMC